MKKVLSLFLAVLMLFSCLSVSASAASGVVVDTPWHGAAGSGKPATYEQVVVQFKLNGGTLKNGAYVWDETTSALTWTENITGTYTMVPGPQNTDIMKPGYWISLPSVVAPSGFAFVAWQCTQAPANTDYGKRLGVGQYQLPEGSENTIMIFEACYEPVEVEENTMAKVMSILIKIFGTILGILLYGGDAEQGQAVLEKIFSSLL